MGRNRCPAHPLGTTPNAETPDSGGTRASTPSDALSVTFGHPGVPQPHISRLMLVKDLNPGSTTFKLKYRIRAAGSYTISSRYLFVMPLG